MADDFAACNVQRQRDDPQSLLSFYRRVIWYRKKSPALLRGSYRSLDAPADTYVYLREDAEQCLLVALNFSSERQRVSLPRAGRLELSTHARGDERIDGSVELFPNEGIVVAL